MAKEGMSEIRQKLSKKPKFFWAAFQKNIIRSQYEKVEFLRQLYLEKKIFLVILNYYQKCFFK